MAARTSNARPRRRRSPNCPRNGSLNSPKFRRPTKSAPSSISTGRFHNTGCWASALRSEAQDLAILMLGNEPDRPIGMHLDIADATTDLDPFFMLHGVVGDRQADEALGH